MRDPMIRNQEDDSFVSYAEGLAAKIRACDEADEHHFAAEAVGLLLDASYNLLTIPKELGGRGANLYQMLLCQERLAEAHASAALVMGWHVGIALGLRLANAWAPLRYAQFAEDAIHARAMINACGTEPETGSPSRGGRPTTTAVKVSGGYKITGRKTWATGSPVLTHILVSAYMPDRARVGEFLVRKGSPGLAIEETWDSMSMAGTGSHTLRLTDVFVADEDLTDEAEPGKKMRRSADGSGWLLHIPATYLGVGNAARAYALEFARTYQPNSLSHPIGQLPHVREKLGQIEIARMSARTFLYQVAERYDQAEPAARLSMRGDLGAAKYVATHAAIRMVDLSMRIVGGNSILHSTPLERYYRDVRAGLHNPPMDDSTLSMLAGIALEHP
ncbi:acyl-CoA dehydrogenase family protein [Ferroacidibacillus organovorans]|uniref:Acyl-CoA dehydrogenase n=1 Tax=Ferroacidibacillus organovorans TaxID=1765683 RepID=A0A853KC05_9BACL|nr:acyl-CoA dehydrogenase family protein [Ferroacidibacillus organovorans]KYP81476.1 hypothetical protein AYJ22_07595 [Ferroacidibacillus organovorans]OAG93981.1 hypothetical protein AYW79_07575 [Ferroacidibacillus organovorans]